MIIRKSLIQMTREILCGILCAMVLCAKPAFAESTLRGSFNKFLRSDEYNFSRILAVTLIACNRLKSADYGNQSAISDCATAIAIAESPDESALRTFPHKASNFGNEFRSISDMVISSTKELIAARREILKMKSIVESSNEDLFKSFVAGVSIPKFGELKKREIAAIERFDASHRNLSNYEMDKGWK